jgi:hypothetical protein
MSTRRALAPLLAIALLASAAVPALAAAPERSKLGPLVVDFEAGLVCDFAVRWDFSAGGNEFVYPVLPNGDQVIRQVGAISQATITNLDDGGSIKVRGGARLEYVFHADGTVDVTARGIIAAAYFAGDGFGPAMWLFRGNLHDRADATFTLIAHEFKGNATDLCAALA